VSQLVHALAAGLQPWPGRPVARQPSLSARTVAAARSALAGRASGWRHLAAFAGPAVVASIAYMDPGNFATNVQAGSRCGYDLLWVVVLANLVAMLFQALSAKLGIVTGRNLAELCPRPAAAAHRVDDVDRQRNCGDGDRPRRISRWRDRSLPAVASAVADRRDATP
jgi:hypothetical protein